MMKLLFIGSVTADVLLRVPALPAPGEDFNLLSQQVTLGGCAYNAFHTAALSSVDCTLFAPVGQGVWGAWVQSALQARGVQTLIPPVPEEHGCCYCLITPDGERTFLCHRGTEYRFQPRWFEALPDAFDSVYVCGLELEEPTGDVILDWLEAHPPRRLYFAPGPRLCHIEPRKMARIMALQPVFHLSMLEATQFTRQNDHADAAALIHRMTQADVLITMGPQGCYVHTADEQALIPSVPASVVDSVGAGDAHIGAVMAAEAEGCSLTDAVRRANRICAAVVAQAGAELSRDAYRQAVQSLRNGAR